MKYKKERRQKIKGFALQTSEVFPPAWRVV